MWSELWSKSSPCPQNPVASFFSRSNTWIPSFFHTDLYERLPDRSFSSPYGSNPPSTNPVPHLFSSSYGLKSGWDAPATSFYIPSPHVFEPTIEDEDNELVKDETSDVLEPSLEVVEELIADESVGGETSGVEATSDEHFFDLNLLASVAAELERLRIPASNRFDAGDS